MFELAAVPEAVAAVLAERLQHARTASRRRRCARSRASAPRAGRARPARRPDSTPAPPQIARAASASQRGCHDRQALEHEPLVLVEQPVRPVDVARSVRCRSSPRARGRASSSKRRSRCCSDLGAARASGSARRRARWRAGGRRAARRCAPRRRRSPRVSSKSHTASRARSANSSTASGPSGPSDITCSPSTPSGSRLVARTRASGSDVDHAVDQVRRAVHHVLAVVEHEQHAPAGDRLGHGGGGVRLRVVAAELPTQRPARPIRGPSATASSHQQTSFSTLGRDLGGQPRLARSTHPG